MSFRVLFVCTGNVCRSPIAERLLRPRLDVPDGLVAESAGTAALIGAAMDAPSALALRELGGDPAGHVGRGLSPELIGAADLVLTAATKHRSAVLGLDPLAFRRTFTMREFARLGAGPAVLVDPKDDDALRARVAEVAGRRGVAEPAQPGADDIGDPFGAPLDQARACAAQVSEAVDGMLAALGLRRADEPQAV